MSTFFEIKVIVFIAVTINATVLKAGIRPPMPHIASTYSIGIANESNEVVTNIFNELRNNGYNIYEFNELVAP